MRSCPGCGAENPDVARFCMACARELVPAPTQPRRKLATLVFCDVSGSTALGERVDPESVRDAMSAYFGEMQEAIERHGGTVEKFIGDAVVAVFGVPTTHEDDALRAVRAAWEMRSRMRAQQQQLVGKYGVGLAVRIGVNTGEVVSGDASSRQTVVTGDAVNVAARLEQAAPADEILVGELTRRLVAPSVTVEPVGALTLKGKSEPLPAYRLVDVHTVTPAQTNRSPMVGRVAEMALLTEAFAEVTRANACRLVTVVGEPGVGKSRLAAEFLDGLPAGTTVLRGRCLSYGQGITYWALGEVVRGAAGIEESDSPAAAAEKVQALLGRNADANFASSRILQAIGLAGGDASVEEIGLASRRLLETLGRMAPTVVVFDDIQWAEPALLDLIGSLPRLVARVPLLVFCLARPELLDERPEWRATELQPLRGAESESLVTALMAQAGTDPIAAARILQVAQGNPLFVEQLVAYLQESTDLAAPPREVALPPSIGAVLAARLDALATTDRGWLEAGAVEGEVFHSAAVAQLMRAEDGPANASLDHLLAGRFVRSATPSLPSTTAFSFHHLLMRDAAYNATAKRLRADLHERFADWLEVAAGQRLPEYEEIVGHHLERSWQYLGQLGPADDRARQLAARAVGYLRPAADRALVRGDLVAAEQLLGRVDVLLPDGSPERPALLVSRAFCLWSTSQIQAARDALRDAASSAAALGDVAAGWQAAVEQVYLDQIVDPGRVTLKDALEVSERAIEALGPLGPSAALTRAWRAAGDALSGIGQSGRAVAAYQQTAGSAEACGDTGQEMLALQQLLVASVTGPMPAREAIALAGEIAARHAGNPLLQASVNVSRGVHLAMRGNVAEARAALDAARVVLTDLDLELYQANVAFFFSGYADLLSGDHCAAEIRVRHWVDVLRRTGELTVLASGLAVLGQCVLQRGDLQEALALSEESLDMSSRDDLHTQATALGVRALVLCQQRQLDAAVTAARSAVALTEPSDWLDLRGDSLRILADVLDAAGSDREALQHAEEALALYVTKGNLVKADRTRRRVEGLSAAGQ